jgi:hypothetical protein
MSHLTNDPAAYTRTSRANALHAALLLTGVTRQIVTELEVAAADIDADAVSTAIDRLRHDVDWLGTVLVHERRDG